MHPPKLLSFSALKLLNVVLFIFNKVKFDNQKTKQWQDEIKYALKQDILIQNETKQAHFLVLTQQLDLLENLLLQSQDNKLQMGFIHYLSAEKIP